MLFKLNLRFLFFHTQQIAHIDQSIINEFDLNMIFFVKKRIIEILTLFKQKQKKLV